MLGVGSKTKGRMRRVKLKSIIFMLLVITAKQIDGNYEERANLALHGIELSHFGEAYVFQGNFQQIFVIENPLGNYQQQSREFHCEHKWPAAVSETSSEVSKITTECIKLKNQAQAIIRQISNKIKAIENSIKFSKSNRTKRQLGVVLAGIGGLIAGSWLQSKNYDNQINELYNRMKANEKEIHANTEVLIALKKLVDSRTNALKESIDSLAKYIDFQKNIINSIDHQVTYISLKTLFNQIAISNTFQFTNLIQNLQFEFEAISEAARDFSDAIIELESGFLPFRIINHTDLSNHLRDLKKFLPTGYKFAIEESEINLYYTLPLTSFTFAEDNLFIRLSIPLSKINQDPKFQMIVPISKPIPCESSICNKLNISENLIQFVEPTELYLADINGNFRFESRINYFNCLPANEQQICITFEPNYLRSLSNCSKAIDSWKIEDIINSCKFQVSNERYYPIRLTEDKYAIHRRYLSSYEIICGHNVSRHNLDQWGAIVSIDANCVLVNDIYTLQGSLRNNQSIDIITLFTTEMILNVNYTNELINLTEQKTLNLTRKVKFNLTQFENNLQFDQQTTADTNKKFRTLTEIINNDLTDFKYKITLHHYRLTFINVISIIAEFLQYLLFVFIVLSVLRNGTWLTIFFPTVVFEQVYAFDFLSDFDVFVLDYFHLVGNIVFLTIILILFILLIKNTLKLKVRISHYSAICHSNPETRFSVNVSFKLIQNYLLSQKIEYISLFVPIHYPNDQNTELHSLVLFNRFCSYKLEKKSFELSVPIKIRGILTDGRYDFEYIQIVNIPVKDLDWNSDKPKLLSKKSYGDAFLDITGDPRPL